MDEDDYIFREEDYIEDIFDIADREYERMQDVQYDEESIGNDIDDGELDYISGDYWLRDMIDSSYKFRILFDVMYESHNGKGKYDYLLNEYSNKEPKSLWYGYRVDRHLYFDMMEDEQNRYFLKPRQGVLELRKIFGEEYNDIIAYLNWIKYNSHIELFRCKHNNTKYQTLKERLLKDMRDWKCWMRRKTEFEKFIKDSNQNQLLSEDNLLKLLHEVGAINLIPMIKELYYAEKRNYKYKYDSQYIKRLKQPFDFFKDYIKVQYINRFYGLGFVVIKTENEKIINRTPQLSKAQKKEHALAYFALPYSEDEFGKWIQRCLDNSLFS